MRLKAKGTHGYYNMRPAEEKEEGRSLGEALSLRVAALRGRRGRGLGSGESGPNERRAGTYNDYD